MFRPEGAEQPVGSINRAELDAGEQDLAGEQPAEEESESAGAEETEDLSSLLKADLVDRAKAAGVDTEGKTKAELVADLESAQSGQSGQEESDGNDSVP